MKNIYFSKEVIKTFLVSLIVILLVVFLLGLKLQFDLYDYTAFSLIHIFFAFFIIGYLTRMKFLKSEADEIRYVVKNPFRYIGKVFTGVSIILYSLGWVLLLMSNMTDIWNSAAVFLAVAFFFYSDMIITKNNVYYRDFIIDKNFIKGVKEINKNKLLLTMKDEKSLTIGLKNVANYKEDVQYKR